MLLLRYGSMLGKFFWKLFILNSLYLFVVSLVNFGLMGFFFIVYMVILFILRLLEVLIMLLKVLMGCVF